MEKRQRITYEKANATLQNNIISTYLPIRYLEHFRSLWLKSRRESKELSGQIKIKAVRHQDNIEIRYDLVNIKRNNTATNRGVQIQVGTIQYHTHPGSAQIPENAFILPSDADIRAFLHYYPQLQFNIVVDLHGIYIITFIQSSINANRIVSTWHDILYTHLSPYAHGDTNRRGYWLFPSNDIQGVVKYINDVMNPIGLHIKYVSYNNRERIPMTFISTRPIRNLPVVKSVNNNNNNNNVNINSSIRSLINRNRKIVTAVSEYHFSNTEQNRKKMVQNAYTNFKRTRNRNGKSSLTFKNFMNRINRLGKE